MAIAVILVTIVWYITLDRLLQRTFAITPLCPEITATTYKGFDWPNVIGSEFRENCGIPNPPASFLWQVLLLALPGMLVVAIYGLVKKRFVATVAGVALFGAALVLTTQWLSNTDTGRPINAILPNGTPIYAD